MTNAVVRDGVVVVVVVVVVMMMMMMMMMIRYICARTARRSTPRPRGATRTMTILPAIYRMRFTFEECEHLVNT